MTVQPGSRVTLHFALTLEDGAVVESTFEREPATFVVGDGNLLPGFEACLIGARAGDEGAWTLSPDQAFGPWNPKNEHRLPHERLPALEPVEGLVVAFAGPDGGELPGVITAVTPGTVTVDFNHPLAGRTIEFRAAVLAVEAGATPA